MLNPVWHRMLYEIVPIW